MNNLKDVSVELPKRRLTVSPAACVRAAICRIDIADAYAMQISDLVDWVHDLDEPTIGRPPIRTIVEMTTKGSYAVILLATADLDGTQELRSRPATAAMNCTDGTVRR